jgi:hypothetical protein
LQLGHGVVSVSSYLLTSTAAHLEYLLSCVLLLLLLQVGFRHSGFLRPGGNLVMKVYEVRRYADCWKSCFKACLCALLRVASCVAQRQTSRQTVMIPASLLSQRVQVQAQTVRTALPSGIHAAYGC